MACRRWMQELLLFLIIIDIDFILRCHAEVVPRAVHGRRGLLEGRNNRMEHGKAADRVLQNEEIENAWAGDDAASPRTRKPTSDPTNPITYEPTSAPSFQPSDIPSSQPSPQPTLSPTHKPSHAPTKMPTASPTTAPTSYPTSSPTKSPTNIPTKIPITQPTNTPTMNPTHAPSLLPTFKPTAKPTISPNHSPTAKTAFPTLKPTQNPTLLPTNSPTMPPTNSPTNASQFDQNQVGPKTRAPTLEPTTKAPTKIPTHPPTSNPTTKPTVEPTDAPTTVPTDAPTGNPTVNPTKTPTQWPTAKPSPKSTGNPIPNPTPIPTQNPSNSPTNAIKLDYNPFGPKTRAPTFEPTTKPPTPPPTDAPTSDPTFNPTFKPTDSPSVEPSQNPTATAVASATSDDDFEAQETAPVPTPMPSNRASLTATASLSGSSQPSPSTSRVPINSMRKVPILTFSLNMKSTTNGEVDEDELDSVVSLFLMEQLPNELAVKYALEYVDIGSYLSTLSGTSRKLSKENKTDEIFQYEFFLTGNAMFSGVTAPTVEELIDAVVLSFKSEDSLIIGMMQESLDPVLNSTEEVLASTLDEIADKVIVDDGDSPHGSSGFNYLFILVVVIPGVALIAASAYYRKSRLRNTEKDLQNDSNEDENLEMTQSNGPTVIHLDHFIKPMESIEENTSQDCSLSKRSVAMSRLSSVKSAVSHFTTSEMSRRDLQRRICDLEARLENRDRKVSKKSLLKQIEEMQQRLQTIEESRADALFRNDSGSIESDGLEGSSSYDSSVGCTSGKDLSCFDPTFMGGDRHRKPIERAYESDQSDVGSTGFDCGLSVNY
mmetsp:Transcript_8523/g.17149  ORF Transcript_8523/g.17149 Transcript_8523/m.17149 type:complete len:825 (-) Transcript_8523:168-2642(-)